MPHIILPPSWRIFDRLATPESVYLQAVSRRSYLKLLGAVALLSTGGVSGCSMPVSEEEFSKSPKNFEFSDVDRQVYPSSPNPEFQLDRAMTEEHIAAQYNNFYEFSEAKDDIWKRVGGFKPRPWTVKIKGLVKNPQVIDVDDLLKTMPLEERLYRHRCVEAWAMAVPWTGFPLKVLVKKVEPLSTARYLRFTSFHTPNIAMGQRGYGPWPYTESLTLAEAMNDLALLATGIYGHPLPKQHGAPIRLVMPWKYGFKSIKSIVSIEFLAEEPATFWNTMAPSEYDQVANVNPGIPHPRWSQATERMLGTDQRFPTQLFNGYTSWVGGLYG
ncbi:MAG: protein-methionine-sulfoxide reductase catalytic subunit MsrP [Nitrospirae bacterium]|nr:protein-methionine-sulfoxide reductase catalytic subunit MsrP [Nitrospirota bacterium]MDA1303369.1 protein-methionine-sulfoxide reductase catalytic subunit MsrP [Nitrospirota bacterium]